MSCCSKASHEALESHPNTQPQNPKHVSTQGKGISSALNEETVGKNPWIPRRPALRGSIRINSAGGGNPEADPARTWGLVGHGVLANLRHATIRPWPPPPPPRAPIAEFGELKTAGLSRGFGDFCLRGEVPHGIWGHGAVGLEYLLRRRWVWRVGKGGGKNSSSK